MTHNPFRDGPTDQLWYEAGSLAKEYNWPDEAKSIFRGVIPEGFGREVGQNIALFLARPIIGGFGWTEQYQMEMRQHALRLVRLRCLLVMLRNRPLHQT